MVFYFSVYDFLTFFVIFFMIFKRTEQDFLSWSFNQYFWTDKKKAGNKTSWAIGLSPKYLSVTRNKGNSRKIKSYLKNCSYKCFSSIVGICFRKLAKRIFFCKIYFWDWFLLEKISKICFCNWFVSETFAEFNFAK